MTSAPTSHRWPDVDTPPRRAPHDALPPGTVLGVDYRVERTLGQGGFGIVYLATDTVLQRPMAVKEYLPVHLAGRGEGTSIGLREAAHQDAFKRGLQSFLREGRLLAQFDHPSLVRVYRFWEENHTAYMAMPFIDGPTLKAERSALLRPPGEAWLRDHLLLPLLGALEALHAGDCLHRDVSPGNIVLGPGGRPVLLDFGSARQVTGDMTQPLTSVLNPAYAAIEQYAESATLPQGPWTDLYSLASVAYFAISGRAPVPATVRAVNDTALMPLAEVAQMIERSFPGLHYSAPFLAVLDSALCVAPGDRPQSAAAFREALLRLHVQPDVQLGRSALALADTHGMDADVAEQVAGQGDAESPALAVAAEPTDGAGADEVDSAAVHDAPPSDDDRAVRAAIDSALADLSDLHPVPPAPPQKKAAGSSAAAQGALSLSSSLASSVSSPPAVAVAVPETAMATAPPVAAPSIRTPLPQEAATPAQATLLTPDDEDTLPFGTAVRLPEPASGATVAAAATPDLDISTAAEAALPSLAPRALPSAASPLAWAPPTPSVRRSGQDSAPGLFSLGDLETDAESALLLDADEFDAVAPVPSPDPSPVADAYTDDDDTLAAAIPAAFVQTSPRRPTMPRWAVGAAVTVVLVAAALHWIAPPAEPTQVSSAGTTSAGAAATMAATGSPTHTADNIATTSAPIDASAAPTRTTPLPATSPLASLDLASLPPTSAAPATLPAASLDAMSPAATTRPPPSTTASVALAATPVAVEPSGPRQLRIAATPAPLPHAATGSTARPAHRPHADAQARPTATASARPPVHVAKATPAAADPRTACNGRTNFSLLYCMRTQCRQPRFASHPQCTRLHDNGDVS